MPNDPLWYDGEYSDVCFYCASLSPYWEMDHFPVQKCDGGKTVVRSCPVCHYMKDYKNIGQWHALWGMNAAQQITNYGFTEEELAKVVPGRLFTRKVQQFFFATVGDPKYRESRLFFAKTCFLEEEGA